jgi:Mlc titration factor MtfA (ptsG expression regulator)
MSNYPLILLQVNSASDITDAFIFAFLSTAIIILMAATGKVNMGFRFPGVSRPLPSHRVAILVKHFDYYNQLPLSKKKIFIRKVQSFIDSKQFIPRQIEYVTEEMKVLVAACAVQLTFGFPKVMLSHFKRVLIYPDDYYSTISKQYHKGEVNPKLRAIVLSWKAFVEGYIDLTDGRNLGLHEMAHAIHLENRINNEAFDFFDSELLTEWHQLAEEEIERIVNGNSTMFRDYAGSNQDEFFSVAVENFFERPEKFKAKMPKLYANLALLLRQDTLSNG